jgi:hypothetical protein
MSGLQPYVDSESGSLFPPPALARTHWTGIERVFVVTHDGRTLLVSSYAITTTEYVDSVD